MTKWSMDELERRREITEKYIERFGEDALPPYVTDIEEAVKRYEECLAKDKPYSELYGEFRTDVIY